MNPFFEIIVRQEEQNRIHAMLKSCVQVAEMVADCDSWELESEVDSYLSQIEERVQKLRSCGLHALDEDLQKESIELAKEIILDNVRNNLPEPGQKVEFNTHDDEVKEYYESCIQRIMELDEPENFMEKRRLAFDLVQDSALN